MSKWEEKLKYYLTMGIKPEFIRKAALKWREKGHEDNATGLEWIANEIEIKNTK
jgi:hypothetical protein